MDETLMGMLLKRRDEECSTPNLDEMLSCGYEMSGSSRVSIIQTDTGFSSVLYEGKKKIISSGGQSIALAVRNLEIRAVEFLGDDAV